MKGRALSLCLFSAFLGLSLLFAVVGAAEIEGSAPTPPIGVGLVLDELGLSDPINWLSYQGLMRAENDLGVVGTVYTPTSSAQYTATLQQCAVDLNVLCVATSWPLQEPTFYVANSNPGVDFAILDTTYTSYPGNLRATQFAHDQAGYMAGVLAGLMTQSDVVGDIGGMRFQSVEDFVNGYRNGAHCANPSAIVLVQYAGTFVDQPLGAQIAQSMMAQGADVIFAAAGPTGVGAVLTATQSGAWGIGVDMDFYYYPFGGGTVPGADKLLSSAIKRHDNVVFETISDTVHSAFTSGAVTYGLEIGGVELAPFHDADAAVSQSVRDALLATKLGIIDGSIDVAEDCREYLYVPYVSRSN